MKLFLVECVKHIDSYGEDYMAVVVAEDEKSAEKLARQSSLDFRKSKLKVREVPMSEASCVLVASKG